MKIANASSIKKLEAKAKAYFFRPVKIVEPLVYTASGVGLIPGFMVEKVGKKFNLVKI